MNHTKIVRTMQRLAFALLLLLVTACTAVVAQPPLTAYFFDVDQGDAILFVAPDTTILIDAGRHDRSEVVSLLRQAGVQTIDLFILTHPHADHIGQCDAVMPSFDVREVWMSGDIHTSRTFERCLDAILASDAGYYEPRAGERFAIGSINIDVLHPHAVTGDLNNGSIAVRLTYGDITFLLTGDAEREAEAAMVAQHLVQPVHILKLGHHGSRTSSTLPFLQAAQPEVAIYSAGRNNTYGHPHAEVMQRLASLGIPVYGTDRHGTVRIVTDGQRYEVYTTDEAPAQLAATTITDTCTPGQININAATAADLTRIVHIGPVTAQRVMEARPFFTLDDLTRVTGIGRQRLDDIAVQGLACIGPLLQ